MLPESVLSAPTLNIVESIILSYHSSQFLFLGLIHVLALQLFMCPCIMQKYYIQKRGGRFGYTLVFTYMQFTLNFDFSAVHA